MTSCADGPLYPARSLSRHGNQHVCMYVSGTLGGSMLFNLHSSPMGSYHYYVISRSLIHGLFIGILIK